MRVDSRLLTLHLAGRYCPICTGSDEFLDIVKHVIAILDVSLHAPTQPILTDAAHIGHGTRRGDPVGHSGGELSLRFDAGEPVLVDLLKRIEQFFLGRKHGFSLFMRLVELANEIDTTHRRALNIFRFFRAGASFVSARSKSETVAQIAPVRDDLGHNRALSLGADQSIDQIELVHRHEFENFAADFALLVPGQGRH